ncbi:MAG: agglutinin biogenesis protein MshI [Betaproteobacteria bacterium CG2_30_59_46]|nr:MAG: agglutinin biogenesis protein MshI [Betaproteobacteria bacterium CG2_30_59_46]
MPFFIRKKQEPGWMAMQFTPEGVCMAHVRRVTDGKPLVTVCTVSQVHAVDGHALEKLGKELHLGQYRCTTLLNPSEYQVLLVEAPNVPPEEMKIAIRWRIKDMLDYHVDDATVDVLDIPPEKSGPAKSHSMYAITARNQVIEQRQALFEAAKMLLSVIDIPEMAQRNISALLEPEQRGLALLSFDAGGGLLTITFGGELYFSRRIDITSRQLVEAVEQQKVSHFDRITLEMQRSFDHFDRQFHFITLTKMMLAPLPGVEGLREYLALNLYVSVEALDLAEVFDFSAVPDLARPERQAQCFTVLGAALRLEEKAL